MWQSSSPPEPGCICWSRLPCSRQLPGSTRANPCPHLFARPVDLHYGPYHLFSCFSSPKRASVLLGPGQVPRAVLLAAWSRRGLGHGHLAPRHDLHRARDYWGPPTPLLTDPCWDARLQQSSNQPGLWSVKGI